MASILQNNDENDNDDIGSMEFGQQDQGNISAQPGAQTQSQPLRPPSPKGSGRFVNLQKYIGANAPQAQQMAGKIGGGIAQKAGAAQEATQQMQTQFGQQAQQEQDRLGQAGQFVQKLGTAPGAQDILQSPEQLQQFKQLQQGQLNLPSVDLSKQQQQLQQLQDQAQLAGTEGGRFQLLRQQFGNPSYTLGQRRLDQLLLQNTPGAAQTIQGQIRPALSGLEQTLGATQQDVSSRFGTLQGLASQAQSDIEQGITSGLSQVEQQAEAARQQAVADRTLKMQQFGIGSLTPEDIQQLGPGFEDPYTSLFNVNLRDYLTSPEKLPEITLGQAASPEQIAQYQALQQLGDRTGQFGAQLVPGQQAIDLLPLNEEQLLAEVSQRQGTFGQEFTPLAKFYQNLASTNLPKGGVNNNQIIRDIALQSGVDPSLMDSYTGALQRSISSALSGGFQSPDETIAQIVQRGAQNYMQGRAQQAGALSTIGQLAPAGTYQVPLTQQDVLRHLINQYSGQTVGALT